MLEFISISVEQFKEVADSVCVAQKNISATDERVVLFLKLTPSYEANDDLINRLKKAIREQLSPRHVPAIILPIQDIPVSQAQATKPIQHVVQGPSYTNSYYPFLISVHNQREES